MPAIIKNLSKFNAIVLFAAAITLGLFYSMQLLIMADNDTPEFVPRIVIPDITLPEIKLEIVTTTPTPEKPENPPVIPEIEPLVSGGEPPLVSGPHIPTRGPVTIDDGSFGVLSDSNAVPIAQIQPQYPTREAIRGIEGFVIVQFDVNENGAVINPEVLVSVPQGAFDRASLRAIERWRYQPKIVDGRAVPMRGLQTKFSFNLKE